MIQKLHLKNFKCFSKLDLELAPLTLLAGVNSSGKSTVIQSIALLMQDARENRQGKVAILNGEQISFGTVGDVINKITGSLSFTIGLSTNDSEDRVVFNADERTGTTLRKNRDEEEKLDYRKIAYLSADRLGPREVHSTDGSAIYNSVGARGERTIWFLLKESNTHVIEELRIGESPTLLKQVEARMECFFPGFKIFPNSISGANIATLSISTSDAVGAVRPQNMGFGLSYTLPIFVMCLSAPKGSVVLIENPEAHLHPKAQSMMGAFLADVVKSGVQVIVETHSDHVLNGLRIATKKAILNNNNIAIKYFSVDKSGNSIVTCPKLDKNGNLSNWPSGFFDQFEKDLETLVDW